MCRIAGFWDFSANKNYDPNRVLTAMRDIMILGGPDSAGSYLGVQGTVGLGHRRLSIIDLSSHADQPMQSERYVLVFNGEIYNYQNLRKDLENKYKFSTQSDTEVILHAFHEWGKQMVHRFIGFFSIAIFDKLEKKLFLIRDRFGVKPMYWYQKDKLFLFASELKSFHEHPDFDQQIDQHSVALFLKKGFIHQPHSIYKNVKKLKGGNILELDVSGKLTIEAYWSAQNVYTQTKLLKEPESALIEELESLLKDSFQKRMVSDVPVGVFLSGGFDSSLVTALLQKENLKTFTIGFDDPEYNEAGYAQKIADHLGTDHHTLYCNEQDFCSVIELLPEIYDEPFGDSSAIPTYLVAKMAREQVKVCLSADGGDELFGGYTKYEITKNYYQKIAALPKWSRKLLFKIGCRIDPYWLERNSAKLPFVNRYKNVSNKYPKLLNALHADDLMHFFEISSSYMDDKMLFNLLPHTAHNTKFDLDLNSDRLITLLGLRDVETYLEGDIMCKVDRATMFNSLEGREPFLDHRLFEFSAGLPDHLKINSGGSKYLLRKILYKYVPPSLMERPKQGFAIPINKWLRGQLSEQLKDMISDKNFIHNFGFKAPVLEKVIMDFLNQRRYINPHFIWFLFILYKWHLRWHAK